MSVEIAKVGQPEIYLEKVFTDRNLNPKKRLTVAKELGETSLMFLVHPTLTSEEIDETCKVISKIINLAKK